MSTEELLSFARAALDETAEKQRAALEGGAQLPFGYGPQPGDTLDLGDKGIYVLPAELIMLIKDRVERLAIGHNYLTKIPAEILFCNSLLYLNLRHNRFDRVPEQVLGLKNLQILDLSYNSISTIPEEIKKMHSVMFLAMEGNKIKRLPLCLGEMPRLTKVKFAGNPIEFPPREVLRIQTSTNAAGDVQMEESRQICTQLKAYLKDFVVREQERRNLETPSPNESSMETPRPPRRTVSGRFPVRPSVSGIDGLESPRFNTENGLMPPPPIPQRSRARDSLVMPNTARRPGIASLSAEGENSRSRSDTVASNASNRSKRLGYVPRKTSGGAVGAKSATIATTTDTGTIRPLHYRGPSQLSNSSLAFHSGNESSSGAVSPVEMPVSRMPLSRRRLSSLPEDRRVSRSTSMSIKLANRVYFTAFQLNGPISDAVRIIKSGTPRKAAIGIERTFFEASASLEELGRRLDQVSSDTGEHRASERDPWIQSIRKKSGHVLAVYAALAGELRAHARKISQRGEGIYVRNLMLHLYGALVELKNCLEMQKTEVIQAQTPVKSARSSLATSSSRSVTPTQAKPHPKRRLRGATLLQPSKLTTPGSVPPPVPLITSRSNTMTSMSGPPLFSAVTPRSGESFSIPASRSTTQQGNYDDAEEQRQFEAMYQKLQSTCELASQVLPGIRSDFFSRKEGAARSMEVRVAQHWSLVLAKVDATLSALGHLQSHLMSMTVRDPGIRNNRDFWNISQVFLHGYFELAIELKNMRRQGHDTESVAVVMRPLHHAVKDVSHALYASPLHKDTTRSNPPSGYVTPVPATPLSAALGPAALATVPSTPRESGMSSSGEYFGAGAAPLTALQPAPVLGPGFSTVRPIHPDKMARIARDHRA